MRMRGFYSDHCDVHFPSMPIYGHATITGVKTDVIIMNMAEQNTKAQQNKKVAQSNV